MKGTVSFDCIVAYNETKQNKTKQKKEKSKEEITTIYRN
jgi:hypothetical protein